MAATRRTIPGWSSLPVNTRGIAWMCGATVCYAALYATLRQLTAGYSPLELIFLRSAICTLFMLPWLASAGPIGGAGLALPASICKRTVALNFFAILYSYVVLAGDKGTPSHQIRDQFSVGIFLVTGN